MQNKNNVEIQQHFSLSEPEETSSSILQGAQDKLYSFEEILEKEFPQGLDNLDKDIKPRPTYQTHYEFFEYKDCQVDINYKNFQDVRSSVDILLEHAQDLKQLCAACKNVLSEDGIMEDTIEQYFNSFYEWASFIKHNIGDNKLYSDAPFPRLSNNFAYISERIFVNNTQYHRLLKDVAVEEKNIIIKALEDIYDTLEVIEKSFDYKKYFEIDGENDIDDLKEISSKLQNVLSSNDEQQIKLVLYNAERYANQNLGIEIEQADNDKKKLELLHQKLTLAYDAKLKEQNLSSYSTKTSSGDDLTPSSDDLTASSDSSDLSTLESKHKKTEEKDSLQDNEKLRMDKSFYKGTQRYRQIKTELDEAISQLQKVLNVQSVSRIKSSDVSKKIQNVINLCSQLKPNVNEYIGEDLKKFVNIKEALDSSELSLTNEHSRAHLTRVISDFKKHCKAIEDHNKDRLSKRPSYRN